MSISSIRRISPLIKGNYGDYRFVGLSDNEKDFIVSSKLMDIVSTLSVGNTVEYEVGVGKTGKPRLVSLNPVIPDSNTMENKPFPVAGTSDSKAYRDDRLVPMLVSYAKDLCPPAPSWEEAVSRVCHMYEYITQFLSEGSTEVVNVESKRPNNLKISKLQIDRILELSKKLGMTNDEQNGISSLLSAYICLLYTSPSPRD